jgi:TetR/AcrR family transcriptional repressor of nem operon
MGAAGFTHGGFYKHFGSKADLIAESASCGFAQTAALAAGADQKRFAQTYLSRKHRDARASGCTLAALGGDAARQPDAVRARFAAGLETMISTLTGEDATAGTADRGLSRAAALDIMARAVGALVLSRACPDDSALADEILSVCRENVSASLDKPGTGKPKTRAIRKG